MSRPSAQAVAARIRRGDLAAVDNIAQAVALHEASDLNAYVRFDAERALAQAAHVDAKIAAGEDPGPLAGVAVSVKDLYGVEGWPTRAGSKRDLPERWQREGFLVKALRSLGAVIVGKTHTVEFAFGGVGLNPGAGTPVNPWDADEHRVPGGSSSGAGVSLWEGSAQLALGSDTGGSIRIPASATGVTGLRQTTGRWPTDGVVPLSSTLDTVGLLARTAADLRWACEAVDELARAGARRAAGDEAPPGGARLGWGGAGTAGGAEGAGTGAGAPGTRDGGSGESSMEGGDDLEHLRIGVPWSSYAWERSEPGVVATVRRALDELGAAGATLLDMDLPAFDQVGREYLAGTIVTPECIEFLERDLPEWLAILDPVIGRRLDDGRNTAAADYVRVQRLRQRASAAVHNKMESARTDVLAIPTLPVAPPTVESLSQLDAYREANRRMLSCTSPASMLDMCAVSLPAGLDPLGMPAGLQLIGRKGADRALLAAAVVAEAALGDPPARLGTPPRLQSVPPLG